MRLGLRLVHQRDADHGLGRRGAPLGGGTPDKMTLHLAQVGAVSRVCGGARGAVHLLHVLREVQARAVDLDGADRGGGASRRGSRSPGPPPATIEIAV